MKRTLFTIVTLGIALIFLSTPVHAEVGVTKDEIVLGTHADLSGPAAAWGIDAVKGLNMRINEINETGGIYGRKIRLVVEDNQMNPRQAVSLTNKMIRRDKVFSFIYCMGSATGLASLPIVTREGVPYLFPLSAHSGFYEPFNRYSFQESPPYQIQAKVGAQYIVETLGAERIGILYQDDEFGALVLQGVKDQLATYGMDVVSAQSYKAGDTDFSTQIRRLNRDNVDFLVLATVIRETVGILAETRKIGWDVPMITMASSITKYVPLLARNAGLSVDGLYSVSHTPYVFNSIVPEVAEWTARFEKTHGEKPDQAVAHGYEAMEWFAIAAEACGEDLTRENLINALEQFDGVPGALGSQPLRFSATNRLGATGAFITQYRNDTFEAITDFIYID